MTSIARSTLLAALLTLGCGGDTPHDEPAVEGSGGGEAHAEAEAEAPRPARVLDDGSQLFGAELDEGREAVALASIVATPADYEGQVVKTEGEIAQVCQAMGCWMEIRSDADSPGIRVPMANHAFFLPRDVAGRRATIEGTVVVAALDAETRSHLESEGAEAADQEISIEASGVLVHP